MNQEESSPEFTREVAAEVFLRLVAARAFDQVIEAIVTVLQEGPAGRKPAENLVQLHRWYKGLDEESRQRVHGLVSEVAYSTIFGLLAILDGVAGGFPLTNTASDFALYLQTYEDYDALRANRPSVVTRLNGSGEDLHDLFQLTLGNRKP